MSDEKEKPTVEEMITHLGEAMRDGFAHLDANLTLVSNEVDGVKDRIGAIETRQVSIDTWRRSNSERVRGVIRQTSETDLAHESKISLEILARQALEKKVDAIDVKQNAQLALLSNIETLTRNPIVRQIFTAVGTAVLTWMATKGIR